MTGQLQMAAVGGLDAAQVLDTLKDIDEARSWLDAQEAKVVTRALDLQTEHTRHDPRDSGYEKTVTASEISAALHIPERTAGFLVEHSTLLTRYCPATLQALEAGKLSKRHAWAVVEEATSIPDTDPTVTADFEARLIGMASLTTVAKFRQQANRLREELHPETITIRRKRAVKERGVFLTPSYDGMAWLEAYLPVDQAAGIFHRVDTAARALQGPDEPRTLTQLRADVLADVLTSAGATGHMTDHEGHPTTGSTTAGGTTTGEMSSGQQVADGASEPDQTFRTTTPDSISGLGGTPGNSGSTVVGEPASRGGAGAFWGVQAKVFVTVPVMTLLGGDAPGELEGYGPIDPETARKLAGHAPSFTRILTHPFTGARLGADATTYRVPKDLQDAVRVRDRTCRHPGCNRLAVFCELDHTKPWSQGGKTSYGNLAALCKRHHKLKSEGYWHYRQPEPGLIIAISPAGETYLTRPDPPPAPKEDPPPF
ncbi:HNH endonuclease [Arthrobacter sp. AET 35A]|nr:HNH endonuclease [Arthrobacter sp. AET 35A]